MKNVSLIPASMTDSHEFPFVCYVNYYSGGFSLIGFSDEKYIPEYCELFSDLPIVSRVVVKRISDNTILYTYRYGRKC